MQSASVNIERRVEWADTDASGHHHHSAIQRWVEAAEAVLLERLGQTPLFGRTPRVRYEVDYRARLWFGDLVRIELAVAEIGTSSLRYRFQVTRGEEVAATGFMTIVHTGDASSGAVPWAAEARRILTSAGPQRPERQLAVPL
jgi:acyl-CoA thioesterase FadM